MVRELVTKYSPCNKKCDLCPAKFLCKTNLLPFYLDSKKDHVFFIIKGTEHEKLARKCLFPAIVIDFIPKGKLVSGQ